MRQILFFATKDDLLPVIEQVESKGRIAYVPTGHYPSREFESYSCGRDLPRLGEATSESSIGCATFLICRVEDVIRPRPFTLNTGIGQFAIDQLINPDTVTFTPGGLWNQEAVLHGCVATVSDSKPAQELMRRFHSAIKKRFARIRAYYVGAEANALRAAGKRLTFAIQAPPEYDLKPLGGL